MESWLAEMIRPGVNAAVDRMVHRTRPDDFHERHPPGRCPLCPMMKNALAGSRHRERIERLMEGLGVDD